jgi:hypothetical protein
MTISRLMFFVPTKPPLPSPNDSRLSSPTALPPFSQLEAVAEGDYSVSYVFSES